MAAIPEDKLELTDFRPKLLFKKKLAKSDLERLYLPRSDVSELYPAAFDRPSNESEPTEIKLPVYDPNMTRWDMFLTETTGDRWRLKGGWSAFARAKEFRVGQEIYFTEYKCNRGTKKRFIMIGRVQLLGGLIG
jgi:hypothetical protein